MMFQNGIRNLFAGCALAALVALSASGPASAEVIGDCTLTGYTFMGGYSAYATTPDSGFKNYFLAQPLEYDYMGTDMWGYAWVKFEVGSAPVDSAYLVWDLLGVGGMQVSDATDDNPAVLDIYSPGEIDVDGLGDDAVLRASLRGNLLATSPLYGTAVMHANGAYSLDITDLYNSWATGEAENNGLILVSNGENNSGAVGSVGSKYAGFTSPDGDAPFISSAVVGTQIPEPTTLCLLAASVAALLRRRRCSEAN